MTGIISYGTYIPRYRIDHKVACKAIGWPNTRYYVKGEKAVANYDEDSLTMSVGAGVNCLKGIDRQGIDSIFFASATPPFSARQCIQVLATALDIEEEIQPDDFGGTLECGVSAVLSVVNEIKVGNKKKAVVCAADMRIGRAESFQEEMFGDGAAAVLIGDDNVVAEITDSFSEPFDFAAQWGSAGEDTETLYGDSYSRQECCARLVVDALRGLGKKCGSNPGNFSKVIFPYRYPGVFNKIARDLRLTRDQLIEPLLFSIGYTGAADSLIHLVKAMENASPGDQIAVISYGGGADAILLKVTDRITDIRGTQQELRTQLASRRNLESYERIIAFRDLLSTEKRIVRETVNFTAIPELWHSRHRILGLQGSRCKQCGTPQYPAQQMCVNPECNASKQMETYRFSDKSGVLITYTVDNPEETPNLPPIYGMVDFDGGGRYVFDLTDIEPEEIRAGVAVEMSFRKKCLGEKFGMESYSWKAVPKSI